MTASPTQPPGGTLGTFGGVFTPSILTILGLVLFLRVSYVVGSVGLIQGMLIVFLATSVSVLTSISLATLATNLKVRGGGEYFLISRTLGIEFGGAVGVVIYLAISVSIAFYAIGFAEALIEALDRDGGLLIAAVAAATVLVLLVIALVGADIATRLQYVVMVLLIVSLISFFIGSIGKFDSAVFADNTGRPDSGVGFWEAFAIFFPAVTGFSQGVAMSGDLKNPSKSITTGTFAAVGLSTVVYIAVAILLAGVAPAAVLVENTSSIMGDVSVVTWTMIVGVLAATLSSALASSLGGPRVLQRLGEDHVLPKLEVFAKGAGASNNPRRATLLSVAIALATVAFGDLNAIAPIISMFFLTSYGLINYATYYEIRAGSTSFRPRFRWYHRRLSLAGTLACGGAILAINPLAGALAGLILVLLYNYLRRREVPDRWTDSTASYHYTQARKHLRGLAVEGSTGADWRPCTLAFVPRDPVARRRMITMASWLEGDAGFTTAVRLIEGSGPVLRRQAEQIDSQLAEEVDEIAPGTYSLGVLVGDLEVGVQTLVQSHGIGSIKPNLALFGARDLRSDAEGFGRLLQGSARYGANVAVLNVHDDAWARFDATPPAKRTIALWWSDDRVGQLVTLLGWLCQRHEEWQDAKIVAFVPRREDGDGSAEVERLLHEARITAEVREVETTPAALASALGGATLVLAPLRVRKGRAIGPFETPLGMLMEGLPLAVMVLAAQEIDLDAQPDEGKISEYAQLHDRLQETERWVAGLDGEAGRLLVAAETLRIEALVAEADQRASHDLQVESADLEAGSAYRKYVDARSRLEIMRSELAALDPSSKAAALDPAIWERESR